MGMLLAWRYGGGHNATKVRPPPAAVNSLPMSNSEMAKSVEHSRLEQGFLQAIIESPDDDDHRLIFADWLEERDDPRGEFIRVQVERARPGVDELREARNWL